MIENAPYFSDEYFDNPTGEHIKAIAEFMYNNHEVTNVQVMELYPNMSVVDFYPIWFEIDEMYGTNLSFGMSHNHHSPRPDPKTYKVALDIEK